MVTTANLHCKGNALPLTMQMPLDKYGIYLILNIASWKNYR